MRIEEGPLTGSYARDIVVNIYDGKMHPVDSNEMAFKLAGRNAFRKHLKMQVLRFLNRFMMLKFLFLQKEWVM